MMISNPFKVFFYPISGERISLINDEVQCAYQPIVGGYGDHESVFVPRYSRHRVLIVHKSIHDAATLSWTRVRSNARTRAAGIIFV